MGVYHCIYCHWVINRPLPKKKFGGLVEFLSRVLKEKFGIRGIKRKVLKNIRNAKKIQGIESEEIYPICRYCLIEVFQLYVNEKDAHRELDKFLRAYDFKGSIIC